jgi:hypothetical protein
MKNFILMRASPLIYVCLLIVHVSAVMRGSEIIWILEIERLEADNTEGILCAAIQDNNGPWQDCLLRPWDHV